MRGNRSSSARTRRPNATGEGGFNPRWLAAARALGYGDDPKAMPAWMFVEWVRPHLASYNRHRLPNGHGGGCCGPATLGLCELRPSLADPPDQVTTWILEQATKAEEFAPAPQV